MLDVESGLKALAQEISDVQVECDRLEMALFAARSDATLFRAGTELALLVRGFKPLAQGE